MAHLPTSKVFQPKVTKGGLVAYTFQVQVNRLAKFTSMRKHRTDEGPRLLGSLAESRSRHTHALSPARKPQHDIEQVIEDLEVADLWYII
jgi:hypothetical protein